MAFGDGGEGNVYLAQGQADAQRAANAASIAKWDAAQRAQQQVQNQGESAQNAQQTNQMLAGMLAQERATGYTAPDLAAYRAVNAQTLNAAHRNENSWSIPSSAMVGNYLVGPQAPPQQAQQMVGPQQQQMVPNQQPASMQKPTLPPNSMGVGRMQGPQQQQMVPNQYAPAQVAAPLPPNSMGVGRMQGPQLANGQFNPISPSNQHLADNRFGSQAPQGGDFLGIMRPPMQLPQQQPQAQMAQAPNLPEGAGGMPSDAVSQAYSMGTFHGHAQANLDNAHKMGLISTPDVPFNDPSAPHHGIIKNSISAVGKMLARVFGGGAQPQTGVGAMQGPMMADGSFNPGDQGQINPQATAFKNLPQTFDWSQVNKGA